MKRNKPISKRVFLSNDLSDITSVSYDIGLELYDTSTPYINVTFAGYRGTVSLSTIKELEKAVKTLTDAIKDYKGMQIKADAINKKEKNEQSKK